YGLVSWERVVKLPEMSFFFVGAGFGPFEDIGFSSSSCHSGYLQRVRVKVKTKGVTGLKRAVYSFFRTRQLFFWVTLRAAKFA
ncbi:MAG TPA: hypothetical protein VGO69_09860, partial [Pyrinomonadaceae bacterium]|nr:hypothetical protein [Pyrinomonadaceae bacterium]